MRKAYGVVGVVGVACVLVACAGRSTSSVDPAPSAVEPPASPDEKGVLYFEGVVDPVKETMQLVYRTPTGEIVREPGFAEAIEAESAPIAESSVIPQVVLCGTKAPVTLPYRTSGSNGVYMHTVNSKWTSPELAGGVCPMNLYNSPKAVCTLTAFIDSITISNPQPGESVGILTQPAGGGGKSTAWTCTGPGSGTGTVASPFVPPCHFSYGNIPYSAGADGGIQLCGAVGAPQTQQPWVFHEFASIPAQIGFGFSFKGHITGVDPTT